MFDWTSLRAFLFTARRGSTLGAAALLGVNQTTVMRRIRQLEAELGVSLFARQQQGYRLTADGAALLPIAEAMESQAMALSARAEELKRTTAGTVRITCTELAATRLLPAVLAQLRLLHPQVRVEVVATDARLDLAKGEADLAIRAGGLADEDGIIRRNVGLSVWSVYCSDALAEQRGLPMCEADLARFPIIAGEGTLEQAPPLLWLRAAAGETRIAFRTNSLPGLLAATRAGLGLSMLPALAVHGESGLIRCAALKSFSSPVWVCYHETRKEDVLLRSVARFVADELARTHHLLDGQ